jgi:hypothetical protein
MPKHLSLFEEFLLYFETLKSVAKGEPCRVVTFSNESQAIKNAVNALQTFLVSTDFERRVFHGPRKLLAQVPEHFEIAWGEYRSSWLPMIMELNDWDEDLSLAEWEGGSAWSSFWHSEFDPKYHDGGRWIAAGIEYLADLSDADHLDNDRQITIGALDYLTDTIGLDVSDVFQRWRKVPITFMPAHVSNKHGQTEKGSLYDLIDNAVRAYVCGAPAAAIAICRAALEMVLNDHYGKGQWGKVKLGKMIVLASQRFDFVHEGRLRRLTNNANSILHSYSKTVRMSEEDEETILEFMKTVKFLIQRAPG